MQASTHSNYESEDKLGRLIQVSVSNLPPGPEQTTYEIYQYDGLSRLVYGENNHSELRLRYDSLGPVIREEQTINVGSQRWAQADPWPQVVEGTVSSVFDGLANRTQLTYPGGSPVVNETYDLSSRRKLIKDGSTTLAEYIYAGRGGRVLQKRVPQASVNLYRAYDADRRVTRHDQRRTTDGVRVAGFSYAWDRAGNRWFERTLLANASPGETAGDGEAFSYDSAYRLRANHEAVASSSLDLLHSNSPRHAGTISYGTKHDYALDGVANRSQTLTNGVVDTVYQSLGTDEQVNQYTTVGGVTQQYDLAGNVLTSGIASFSYSHRNQLLSANTGGGPALYRFDVFGRRILKRMAAGNFPDLAYGYVVYINSGARILVEHSWTPIHYSGKRWIYGDGLDEPIRQTAPDSADLDNDGNTSELANLHYLTNSLGTVVGLMDGSGAAKERYVLDVWGTMRDVIDKNGVPTGASWTKVGNPWAFTGRQFEHEERHEAYDFRSRRYLPRAGSFVQRDPLGVWGDSANLGRSRSYCGHNPTNRLDPLGLYEVTGFEGIPDFEPWKTDEAAFMGVGGIPRDAKILVRPGMFACCEDKAEEQGTIYPGGGQIVKVFHICFGGQPYVVIIQWYHQGAYNKETLVKAAAAVAAAVASSATGAVGPATSGVGAAGATAVARLTPPAIPAGMTQSQFGQAIGWGTGNEAARARITTISAEALRKMGVTPEMAREWRTFYENELLRSPNNPSAAGRVDLMRHIERLLGGE